MMNPDRIALASLPFIVLIGAGIALAGSQGGVWVFGMPLFACCVGLAFVIQWIVFVPAYIGKTERFFDLTGAFTYVTVALLAIGLSPVVDCRSILLVVLVLIWAIRLGTFLFRRILSTGNDSRFDELKTSFPRFLMTWTLQGLWVALTISAALAAITTTTKMDLDLFAGLGSALWGFGFAFEVVADNQKSRFRSEAASQDRFINSGLWSRSRHPNYLGEIILWTGIAIVALPVLRGWQWVTLVSPVFVAFLLIRVSGIPMLERKADARWGGQKDYEAYKKRTPVLIPSLFRK
jgi:steroid 5-alpha reductase family enzyme